MANKANSIYIYVCQYDVADMSVVGKRKKQQFERCQSYEPR